jgi:ATP/maltotriose-dependent transcriptional regulator MalT
VKTVHQRGQPDERQPWQQRQDDAGQAERHHPDGQTEDGALAQRLFERHRAQPS